MRENKKKYKNCKIISNEEISKDIFKMQVKSDIKVKSGQFFMLRGWEDDKPYLSRPISIADEKDGVLTFLYLVKGKGTKLISDLKEDEEIKILGPLGNGFDTENLKGRGAIICGGIGIAPFMHLAKTLNQKGVKLDMYAGFNSEVYFADEIKKYLENLNIYTMDGSSGKKGYPTQDFDEEKYDFVLCCGPTPMMDAVRKNMKNKEKLYLSLESKMGCAIGVCLSCSIKTKDGQKRVCKDGPVFRGDYLI